MTPTTPTPMVHKIARRYRELVDAGVTDPNMRIADERQCSPATIRAYVYCARKFGLLPPTNPGCAGYDGLGRRLDLPCTATDLYEWASYGDDDDRIIARRSLRGGVYLVAMPGDEGAP